MTDVRQSEARTTDDGSTDAPTTDGQISDARASVAPARRPKLNRLAALAAGTDRPVTVVGGAGPDPARGDVPKTGPEAPVSGPQRSRPARGRGTDGRKRPKAAHGDQNPAPSVPRGPLTRRPIIRMPDALAEDLSEYVGQRGTSRRQATGLNAKIPTTKDNRGVASAHVIRELVGELLENPDWQMVLEARVRAERTASR
jgi:hypothetical protein